MSGPKVVRIVTREELIAQCEGLLARVAAALEAWEHACGRAGGLTEADKATSQARLARLRQMLTEDRFGDIQKEVPRELAFLKDDQRDRLAKAAAAAAAARLVGRRRGEAAKALLATLDKAGAVIDEDLRAALKKAATGQEDPAALARGFALLSAAGEVGTADRQALVAKYKDDQEDRSFATWLEAQPQIVDPRTARLQAAVDEITALGDATSARAFQARLTDLTVGPAGPRRNLLIDSVEVELGQALRTARVRAGLLDEIGLDLAELVQLAPRKNLSALRQRLESAVAARTDLAPLAVDVAAALVAAKAAFAAKSRREAVLKSLAGLGYEVTEGLSTAWVSEGKVVLRKADRPDYGVEISGGAEAARFQMRAVAFVGPGGGPDLSRDRDAETLWCGDVSALKADLFEGGGDLIIEKALAIGATPLKRIEVLGAAVNSDFAKAPAQRTLKPS